MWMLKENKDPYHIEQELILGLFHLNQRACIQKLWHHLKDLVNVKSPGTPLLPQAYYRLTLDRLCPLVDTQPQVVQVQSPVINTPNHQDMVKLVVFSTR